MRSRSILLLFLGCAPIACATGVDDGRTVGSGDTGSVIDDSTAANDVAGDATKDSGSLDAGDGASRDARDSSPTFDSTVVETGADGGDVDSTIDDADSAIDSGKIDTGKVDTGKVDSAPDVPPSDAGAGSLLISEVQTRGTAGGNDEFIELYNPGSVAVAFDSTWTLAARSAVGTCATNLQALRYTGTGQIIGPHRHLLLTNSTGYDGLVVGDDTYATGVVDASSVLLLKGATVIDAVCFYYDATTLANLSACAGAPYTCEGTPVTNLPHNNTGTGALSNTDVSIDRKPGGAAGNGTDTGDSAADFTAAKPANPQNLLSPAAP